jgi:hypothetical protein
MLVAEAFKFEPGSNFEGLTIDARGCIIEIGRELLAAKDEIPHGEWLQWLEREFAWSNKTAEKYMQAIPRKRARASRPSPASASRAQSR